MRSIPKEHVRHLEGFAALYQTVVGQILEIQQEEWSRVIALETPLGDIVYLQYQPDAIGTTPFVGGVYAITYQVQGGSLRVVEVKKPAPGQYRVEFEKSTDYSKDPGYQRGSSYERPYTATYTPSPRREVRSPPSRGDVFAPTRSVSKGVRPDGISLIAVLLLLVGAPALMFGLIFGALPFIGIFGIIVDSVGIAALLLGWGVYTYREWARVGMLVISVLLCITIIGLVIGGPIFWYLEQKHIKRMFVF